MGKTEEVRAGVAELRSVAQRLEKWAAYLESTFLRPEVGAEEVPASGSRPGRRKKDAVGTIGAAEAAGAADAAVLAGAADAAVAAGAADAAVAAGAIEGSVAAGPDGAGGGAVPETGKALTLPEVRAILAEKCAAGFATQVKALIESYGASSLKGVPAEKYEELLEAVRGLGETDAG